jgi:hypothetical protein
MNNFWKQAAQVSVFGLLLLLITSPITRSVWSQAPIKGEVSTGVYQNIKTDGSGRMQVAPTSAVVNTSGATFSQVTITVTSGVTAISPADAAQRYFQVQNNSATGTIYVAPFSPVSATTGVKVGPAQTYWPLVAPTSAMYAIGDIASNSSVVVTTAK